MAAPADVDRGVATATGSFVLGPTCASATSLSTGVSACAAETVGPLSAVPVSGESGCSQVEASGSPAGGPVVTREVCTEGTTLVLGETSCSSFFGFVQLDAIPGNGDVFLSWVASGTTGPFNPIDHYDVYRSSSSANPSDPVPCSASGPAPGFLIAQVPAVNGATFGGYTDAGLDNSKMCYYYVVRAVDQTNSAGFDSNVALGYPHGRSLFAWGEPVTISWTPADNANAELHAGLWDCQWVQDPPAPSFGTWTLEATCQMPGSFSTLFPGYSPWKCRGPFAMAGLADDTTGDEVDVDYDCATQTDGCPANEMNACATTPKPLGEETLLGTLDCKATVTYGSLADVQGWSVACYNDP